MTFDLVDGSRFFMIFALVDGSRFFMKGRQRGNYVIVKVFNGLDCGDGVMHFLCFEDSYFERRRDYVAGRSYVEGDLNLNRSAVCDGCFSPDLYELAQSVAIILAQTGSGCICLMIHILLSGVLGVPRIYNFPIMVEPDGLLRTMPKYARADIRAMPIYARADIRAMPIYALCCYTHCYRHSAYIGTVRTPA